MTPPPPDASVHLHLKCPDAEDFVERFAPNVTPGGIFLPTRDARTVGATIRFEIALLDDTVVFAGEGVVTWAKPKGMGVKFTTLDPATEPMLERLLSRREARPTPPSLQASPTPAPTPATGRSPLSIEPRARRPLVRVAIVCSAVFVGVAILWMSIGRARVRPEVPSAPPKPATVEIAAPPTEAPPAPTEAPPPPTPPTRPPLPAPSGARSDELRVEKMLAGASYKNFTCPNPTARFSAKSSRTVNVCLQVAHRPGKTDRLTLVWERNGAFAGKTRVELPASKPTVRTRAHMKISANRVGTWSVRVVSDRSAPLAQTAFDVVP
jgi:Tfp pilus assembly protein PilZ